MMIRCRRLTIRPSAGEIMFPLDPCGICDAANGLSMFAHLRGEEIIMNWDRIEGNWKQVAGKAREKWGKITADDWTTVAGKREQLVGKIQERYGVARDEAQKQADEWARALKEDQGPHS
jgi:uncharacterized protein YjbJ (UPF0337 family)